MSRSPASVGERPPAGGEKATAASQNPPASADKPDPFAGKSGRIIHDERGNAVWDWLKETSRIAIDSTSRLLKRLEVPELKMEDDVPPNNELSLESERDAGGGYDPYGGSKSGKAPVARGGGIADPRASAKSGGANTAGGYDPYGKSDTRKTTGRKP